MTEAFVDTNGVKLWTVSEGTGMPIVLCSGGPGCCDYLAPVAAMVHDVAQAIRFEQRGCGRSMHAPPYTIATCIEDLEAIRAHYGIDRWIVAGHSWGADLALIYALHYPEHTCGFVCMAGGRVHNDREWHAVYSARRDQGLEPELAYAYPPNLEVNQQVNQSWKQYVQHPMLLSQLASLNCPALFLYGDQDIRPSWPVEQVANLLPGAHFELQPGANHYIWHTHAEQVRTLLRNFVAQCADLQGTG